MRLISEWKWIVRKAWSVRLIMIAGLLSGVEAVLPLFADSCPRGIFAALSLSISVVALGARVTQQNSMDRRRTPR